MATKTSFEPFLTSWAPKENEDFVMTGYELQYKCPGTLICVVLSFDPFSTSSKPESIEDGLLRRLEDAGMCPDDAPESGEAAMERIEVVENEIIDLVERECRPLFHKFTNARTDSGGADKANCPKLTVYQHMHPAVVSLQLVTQNGRLKVIERDDLQPRSQFLPSQDEVLLAQRNSPVYQASQLDVLEVLGQWILKVSADEEIVFCKLNVVQNAILTEYRALRKITEVGLSTKVPKLRGLVSEGDGVIGLLLDYIEPKHSTLTAALQSLGDEELMQKRKVKWAAQLEQTVRQLHEIGIVWGDAKPNNILIDKRDDAWLLDFGGGWTEGWVDRHLANTTKGDLQAVERMRKMLLETS